MARDRTREAFPWRWQERPEEEPPEVRDVAVDPFSLRQFSQLDIDRPLPIPSVSVDASRASPARLANSGGVPAGAAGAPSPPRASADCDIRIKAMAAPAGWDDVPAAHPVAAWPAHAPSSNKAMSRTNKSSAGGEAEVPVPSSEQKAGEPQRWGSDVPLIAAGEYSTGYSKDGRGKQQAARRSGEAPFTCCMYVPGRHRRGKPPVAATAAARSSSSGVFRYAADAAAATAEPEDPGTSSARPSAMSMAVSLERFDCGSLSTSSYSREGLGLGLDLDDGEAARSSSYFDLPLELILGCDDGDGDGDDADLPVCAAFLFDGDGIRRSVLKRRLAAGAGWEPRRPSLGKVPMDASGRISGHHVRISLKSRSSASAASASP